jgi:hypothetical protein
MPSPPVQLEELGAGNPEDADLGWIGRQIAVTCGRLQWFPPLLTTLVRRPIHDRWLGHSEVPVLATDGAQALGHAGVVCDGRELQRPVLQSHDVEPATGRGKEKKKLESLVKSGRHDSKWVSCGDAVGLPRDAAAEVELRIVRAELVAVGGGGDDLSERREGLGRGLHRPQLHHPRRLLRVRAFHLRGLGGAGAHGGDAGA